MLKQNIVVTGKNFEIKGYADKKSGLILINIVSDKQTLSKFRLQDFENLIQKIYKGGVEITTYTFKNTFTKFGLNSYDTSQSSLKKLIDGIKQHFQKM